jgi:hypothetical protein
MAENDGLTIVKSKVSNETCEKRRVDKNGRCPGEVRFPPTHPTWTFLRYLCSRQTEGSPSFPLGLSHQPFFSLTPPSLFIYQAGYMPPNNAAPKDFAEFQKEMAAKKAAMKK